MSGKESQDSLPRVVIKKGKENASIQFNFRTRPAGSAGADAVVEDLLELSDDWLNYCVASLQFSPLFAHAGYSFVGQTINEDVFKYVDKISISKEETVDLHDGSAVFSFIIHDQDIDSVAKAMQTTGQMIRAADSLSRAALGSIISEFEYFLLRLVSIVARRNPKKFYDPSEKITLQELTSLGSIDAIVQKRIQQTISLKLRESHDEIVMWLLGVLEINEQAGTMRKDSVYRDFLEICQRRHILMHNGGEINQTYLEKCKKAGIDASDLGRLGEKIEVSPSYYRRATARVFLLGHFLLHIYFQKTFENDIERSFKSILNSAHTFLENGLTKMCTRICDFAEFSSKKFDQDMTLRFGVNRALAKLFDPSIGPEEQVILAEKELENYDWSVITPVFQLALSCIRRDYSNLIEQAEAAAVSGLTYNEVCTYVVFSEVRDREDFMNCFPRRMLAIEDQC